MDRPQTAPAKKTSAIASGPTVESADFSANSDSLEHCLAEVPKEQPDELWPTPLWPGHFCKRSLLQLRDSSGLATQQPPYCFAVRYDIRPLVKQLSEKSAYLMLLDGEKLRRIGRGSGVDIIAASKSWIAWGALCAQPLLLTRDAQGKLVGEAQVQPELDCHANGEGVLLMTVVLTSDIKNRQLWQTAGDLMSYRLGSPQVLCGLCSMAVPMRELSAHQSHQCRMVLSACPRCHKEVPIRELAAHQVGPDCLGTSSMGTQTLEKKVQDAPSQCSVP
ncbi:SPCC550.07, partial [Symbiodinium necroappetens]